jgi:hypothetical protein
MGRTCPSFGRNCAAIACGCFIPPCPLLYCASAQFSLISRRVHSEHEHRVAVHENQRLSGLALELWSVQLVHNTVTGKGIPCREAGGR